MSKRYVVFFLLPILSWICSVEAFDGLELEARVAYLYFQDSRNIRDIYGHGTVEYELEADLPFDSILGCGCGFEGWDGFLNLAYYQKTGRSTCEFEHNHTRVRNFAFNFGLLHEFETCFSCYSLRPYLGFGVGAVNVEFHDHSEFVKKHTNKWGVAILAKSGVKYDITCSFFVDLFLDYTYHWYHFHKRHCASVHNVNTGGLLIGGGIGYKF